MKKAIHRKKSFISSLTMNNFSTAPVNNKEKDEIDHLTRDAVFALKFVGKGVKDD